MMFQIQTEVKKVEKKYSEDGRHNFHIFLKVMLSLQQNSDKQYVVKFLLVPSSDLRRKKGHQIVASMGQNAGKIKASNVKIKMQMPLQRDLRRLEGDKKNGNTIRKTRCY